MSLSTAEVRALGVLSNGDQWSVADFGAAMGYKQRPGPRNNLTGARVLSRLREKGLVMHAPTGDERWARYRWWITTAGERALRLAAPADATEGS